jgi:hypothetical protein
MFILRQAAAQRLSGGGGGSNVPFASVDATGSTVTWPGTPVIGSPGSASFSVTRWGYDTSATLSQFTDTVYYYNRLREPYPTTPNYAGIYIHPTPDRATISEPVHRLDTCTGATNNSLLEYYKPVANWMMIDRLVVANSIYWEMQAFHHAARNNEQVACVRVRGTDGTNFTSWQTVSTSTTSPHPGDRTEVDVYAGTLDITGLTDNSLITLEAEVYPWIGDAAAVLSTADITTTPQQQVTRRQFCTRKYWKDTVGAGIVPRCYVSTTGVDATGVWASGRTYASEALADAAARAAPFLTVGGALNRYAAGAGGVSNNAATAAKIDGCEIRVQAGTFDLGTTAYVTTRTQNLAGLVITRDTGVARTAAIVELNSGNMRARFGGAGINTNALGTGMVIFRDITVNRAASISFLGEAYSAGTTYPLDVIFDYVVSDLGNFAASWLGSTCHFGAWGWEFTNAAVASAPPLGGNPVNYKNRGLYGTLNRSGGLDGWHVVGSEITGCPPFTSFNSRTESGCIISHNKLPSPYVGALVGFGSNNATIGCVFAQNLIENTSNGGAPGYTTMGISADSGLANTEHTIVIYNTATGEQDYGRWNMWYDSRYLGASRVHKLAVLKGNIGSNFAQKNDIFATNGSNIGGWPYAMGTSCVGNWGMYTDGGAGNYSQEYGGLGTTLGTTLFTRNDPDFVNYQGVYNVATVITAGAGGGDYNLKVTSPCKNIVPVGLLKHDLAGNERNATGDSAGAYFKA